MAVAKGAAASWFGGQPGARELLRIFDGCVLVEQAGDAGGLGVRKRLLCLGACRDGGFARLVSFSSTIMTSLLLVTAALLPQGPVPAPQTAVLAEAIAPCLVEVQTTPVVTPLSLAEASPRMGETGGADEWQLVVDEAALRRASAAANRRTLLQDPGTHSAGSGLYAEVDLGLSFVSGADDGLLSDGRDIDLDPAVMFGVSVGYRFLHHWRAELNFNYRDSDVDKVDGDPSGGSGSLSMLMANFYYDFMLHSKWNPYVGAGMGNGSFDLDATDLKEKDSSAFAFSLMAGVSYRLTPKLDLDFGYRWQHIAGIVSADLDANDLVVGMRYNF